MTATDGHGIRSCTLEEFGEKNWNELVVSLDGTVYHHPAWHRAIELTYGIKPLYLVREGSGGVVLAAMPAARLNGFPGGERLVSYPFSDICGPIFRDAGGAEELMDSLAGCVGGRSGAQIELRTSGGLNFRGFATYDGYVNFALRLDRAPEDLMGSFHRDCVQRRLKKAFRSGLGAFECSSMSDLRDFYGLHLMARKRQGAPVQPFSFFKNIRKELFPRGLASLVLVKKKDRAVSGVLLLKFRDTAYYKFGATDETHFSAGAGQLALWTAIKKSAGEGYGVFDLGRTFIGNRGLMEFKSRWGAEAKPLSYMYRPRRKSSVKCEGRAPARAAAVIFRMLPCFSNRLLGRLFYRYLA